MKNGVENSAPAPGVQNGMRPRQALSASTQESATRSRSLLSAYHRVNRLGGGAQTQEPCHRVLLLFCSHSVAEKLVGI